MKTDTLFLEGKHVRLEPLELSHTQGLAAAAAADPSLYQWSPVPQGETEARKYVETALTWRDAGTAVPFAIVRADDDTVVGSTRFLESGKMVMAAEPCFARQQRAGRM
jgi:N-acetyltransferase